MIPFRIYYVISRSLLLSFLVFVIAGCGSSGGSSGYGDVAGGVSLENMTTSRSFESSASLSAVPIGATQKAISILPGKGMNLLGAPKVITDTAVNGTAVLYDMSGSVVDTTEIVNGEYAFSSILAGTYKLVLTLDTPEDFAGMNLSTYVDIAANGVSTPRPDPLSTIMVERADAQAAIYGISPDNFDPDMMVTKIRDCYETSGDNGIDGSINLRNLSPDTLADMFDNLPSSCKMLGYTSFARGRLLAAGNDVVKVTQAMCEILYRLGFVVTLNEQDSLCHPRYDGSPFTEDQVTENYCPEGDPNNCEDWGGAPYAVVPTVVEWDRNRPSEEAGNFLPMFDEYSIMTLAQAYANEITVTPQQIYSAMTDPDGLGLRLCFDSGRGSQYCFGADGSPVLNQLYGVDEGPSLLARDTKPPDCNEILPILCDEGETISDFSSKPINVDVIKEDVVFKRVHVSWNKTGGPYEWVVFDGDPWAGDSDAGPVYVNITMNENFEITNIAQAADGKFVLGFDEHTNETGSVRPVDRTTGLWMRGENGRDMAINLGDITFLGGVNVRETGSHIYGGPPADINGFTYGVIYDGWQSGASPIQVCVTYSSHYTVAQNEDGSCDSSYYYLSWHETTETDNSAHLLSSATGECALTNPSDEQSEDNPCVKWPFTGILGLNEFEYRDTHTYVYGGQFANPRYNADADPYFDDFPPDLCNIDADGNGVQDDGDGIWCSETLADAGLCNIVEPTFSWRPYLANADAPYSIDDNFYRWKARKQFVREGEDGGAVQTIECGDSFRWNKIPPGPGNENNILANGSPGDAFDFMDTPAANGLTPRNFKARLNTYAVGRPNAMINMASLAFGGKSTVTPNTTFNIIEAFAMIYMAWNVETNVAVPEITIPNFAYDPETEQETDATLINEIFYATFYEPRDPENEFRGYYQRILGKFGVPDDYLDNSSIWNLFHHE